MIIKILGNGGAINDGLPYNSFIVNNSLLCETPPDIMLSLLQNGIKLSTIKSVYISHLHGDHIFGLPFLILSAFLIQAKGEENVSYSIIGPQGIEEKARNLVDMAFRSDHPCFDWMDKFCSFQEIDESSGPILLQGYSTSLFMLDHMVETYGFILSRNNDAEFAYVADTRWCDSVESILNKKPRIVLIDLNGQNDDPAPVHISMKELKEKGIPITREDTRYVGTHLKEEFESNVPWIQCARPGIVVEI